MKWGSGSKTSFTEADNKGREVWIQFKGLPTTNDQFGLKVVTMTTPKETETNKIEVFFNRQAKNHPGGDQTPPALPRREKSSRSPNWFYYWNQTSAGDSHALFNDEGDDLLGEVPAMYRWALDMTFDKKEIWIGPASAYEIERRDGSLNPDGTRKKARGIDAFANLIKHEQHHVKQIAEADAYLNQVLDALKDDQGKPLIPDKSKTMWAKGWSWNRTQGNTNYGSFNHWSPGADGKPGIPGYNDDDGRGDPGSYVIDQLFDNHEFGNDTYPSGKRVPIDDVNLDENPKNDIPDVWGPQPPVPPGEHAAEGTARQQETVEDNTHWQEDWGSVGKQHHVNKKYDD